MDRWKIIRFFGAAASATLVGAAADEAGVKYLYAGGWGEPNPPSMIRQLIDMTTGPDGNLYVLHEGGDYNTYIQVFDAEGLSLRTWGGEGSGLSTIADTGAIAVDDDGTVYAISGGIDYVIRFTPEGERAGEWTHERWRETQSLRGLACAPDGTTYVVDGKGRVDRFTAEGKHLGDATPSAGATGEGAEVRAIAVADDGRFYAATGGKRVGLYKKDGSAASEITWDDEFGSPDEITVGPDGVVYVSDGYRVRAFGGDGSVRGEWDPGRRDTRGEPASIRGLAVGRDGTVYVGDYFREDIFCFAGDGTLMGMIDATVAPLGYFDEPHGVAISADGRVYVADYGGRRVQYFTAEGEPLGQWSERGGLWLSRVKDVALAPGVGIAALYEGPPVIAYYSPDGELLRRWVVKTEAGQPDIGAFAISPDGILYIVPTTYGKKIIRFSAEGESLGEWGKEGEGPGEFGDWMGAVAVGREGRVYVSDGRHNRVQYFTRTGKYVGEWSVEGDGWSGPDELAVGPSGDVFVGCGAEVYRFTAGGEFLTKWGGRGDYPGQFDDISGIAVALDGTVYVADGGNGRIQYFRPGPPAPPPVPEGGLQYRWSDD
jgi:tripartite motif-containing protein 71